MSTAVSATNADLADSQQEQWYLSFDCATKSFAFALLRVRKVCGSLADQLDELTEVVRKGDLATALRLAEELDSPTRAALHLAGGGAADLRPGKKDKDIPTVDRVRAVKDYLEGAVAGALSAAAAEGCPPPDSPQLNVAVEFQMGPNAPARTVAIVILSHFSRANTFLVGPAYKNRLWYPSRPDLRHCHFVEKYKSLYTANKNHAKSLYFDHIAKVFGHDKEKVLAGIPTRLRKDFADCVVQILGLLSFGDIEKAAEKF